MTLKTLRKHSFLAELVVSVNALYQRNDTD